MRIVTLIENVVNGGTLQAEHGLSLYIETENKKILFDVGQSGLFLKNAQKLGVDISDVDCLVLSHGHYDHTGGLYPFLEINSKAKVFAKRNLFLPKQDANGCFKGTVYREDLLKNRLVYVDSITEIVEDVFIMPDIPLRHPIDTHFDGLFSVVDNQLAADEFEDELFMVLKQGGKINILTACSHRGITNMCIAAIDHFELPVGLILGGFHMKSCSVEQYVHVTHYLRMLRPVSVGVCHCTGLEKFADMYHECEAHLYYSYTGKEVVLG
ncbi:MBL fold metallo-hydrolase [Williamwhitmania taraxaci]|uniref:7,8-dihydropterin-6-yl-methyl-4-(Beta-D-ribofuranosyl)aminobenzene 5'-phosphate synthase n=1 Tax=Williamwhitmania taraxaci TaxID=1640674 RepID=A0A1G6HG64_9BACT|nr:MBL fold metallo-hydrolase [Williamwhitmania taraxaci]SDB93211.1 7,8-dihydropterin-6-yl-methyl-4-(beta-D-ribofuranosyl)aminobenzene 5'-phosphate synthase [Williamwhitmania taraxaci]